MLSRVLGQAVASQRRAGFSLIELIVCIGIVMVLLGLIVPSIAAARGNARTVADAAQIRQCYALVALYSQDHAELFPVARPNAFDSARMWYEPIKAGGYVGSVEEVDPSGVRRFQSVTFDLSVCAVYDASMMMPGMTVAVNDAVSAGVRQSSVVYPSAKGVMLKRSTGEGTIDEGATWFCCHRRWPAPVAMGDGAVLIADYLQFNGGQTPFIVDGVGVPVYSTWGGYLGRDR